MKNRSDVIKRVYAKLSALSTAELRERLRTHREGDFARIFRETGAIDANEIKVACYQDRPWVNSDSRLPILPILSGSSLFFDLTKNVASTAIAPANLELSLGPIEEHVVIFKDTYLYSNISLPKVKFVEFDQPSLWGSFQEYIRQHQPTQKTDITQMSNESEINGDDEDDYKWAKAA